MAAVMPLDRIPDWRRRIERQDAFWDRHVLDRPVVWMTTPAPALRTPWPAPRAWPTLRDRWLDAEWQADLALARALNTDWWGDALPTAWPNLGPEVFSAWFGAPLEFSQDSSWSVPTLDDWAKADAFRFDPDNPYWRALEAMTGALLERGRGVFYTGLTDLHPGADAIAAFRDPEVLAVDLLDRPDEVRRLLRRVTDGFFAVFDRCSGRLEAAGQPSFNWTRITSTRRHYCPSNDFSCMISKAMFDDFFLPGLAEECRHLGASLYHLDGPGAIRHLDSLLAIPELTAVQWVPGAGKGPATRWLDLYRRIQAAGKAVQVLDVTVPEVATVIEALDPRGVWLDVVGVRDADEARAVLRQVERWR